MTTNHRIRPLMGAAALGGSGEEVPGHRPEIQPCRRYPGEGIIVAVAVTEDAAIPGERPEIPQVRETFRYLSVDPLYREGSPPPRSHGQHRATARDDRAPSRNGNGGARRPRRRRHRR
jgi:hypothetical protein